MMLAELLQEYGPFVTALLVISLTINVYLGIKFMHARKSMNNVLQSTEELLGIWDGVTGTINEIKGERKK